MAAASDTSEPLLDDIETAIDRALDNRQEALLGALYRIQGSVHGWCNDPSCGKCPLAPMRCINGLDERLDHLITEYHADDTPKAGSGNRQACGPDTSCTY
ncbi:MAG: hypothetical protein EP335_14945 [Alphaproteobacteria bacterium]|nr:MAG: hypothetical protein EP335_14945 [Alphaproteobacteria bacterium]